MGARGRGGIGFKVAEYAWIGKERKGLDSKNRGAGGVRFLGKKLLCDIIELIEDTKYVEGLWIRAPRERGAK